MALNIVYLLYLLIHFLSAGHQVASKSCVPHQSAQLHHRMISQCTASCVYPYGHVSFSLTYMYNLKKKKKWPSQVVLVVKNLLVNAEDTKDTG